MSVISPGLRTFGKSLETCLSNQLLSGNYQDSGKRLLSIMDLLDKATVNTSNLDFFKRHMPQLILQDRARQFLYIGRG